MLCSAFIFGGTISDVTAGCIPSYATVCLSSRVSMPLSAIKKGILFCILYVFKYSCIDAYHPNICQGHLFGH